MDVLGWIGWLLLKVAGLVWGLVWFLIGGWVSTIAQIAVIALGIFAYKYGWQRAPQEILARGGSAGRWLLGWVRTREPREARAPAAARSDSVRRSTRGFRPRQFGDINVSTLLSLLAIAGLVALVRL